MYNVKAYETFHEISPWNNICLTYLPWAEGCQTASLLKIDFLYKCFLDFLMTFTLPNREIHHKHKTSESHWKLENYVRVISSISTTICSLRM